MRTRVIKYLKSASAVMLMGWALLPTSADAQGIVLTGGSLSLDFGDPNIGGNSTTLDRLDKLTWSGGDGALAGQNLVSNSGSGSCNGDPAEFWGQSYGEPENTYPLIIFSGSAASASNVTTTSMTSTATGIVTCSCGSTSQAGAPATTVYNVFPAGDPNVNEMRVSRTIQFSSSTPVFNTNGVRGYVARLPISTYGTVLIPNAAGTAINTVQAGSCSADCEITDWNGKWFADDNGSGSGMVVFRDTSSTNPAIVSVNNDGASSSNLTSIVLLQPTRGWQAPVTETEWLCFYDPTTWTAAQQAAGTLPVGCAQHPLTAATVSPFAFAAQTQAQAGSNQMSNTQQINGISAATPISIVGGTYSINGGPYTSAAGTISNGDYVSVQVSASQNPCTTIVATLTIGGMSAQFAVTTPATTDVSLHLNITPNTIAQFGSATLSFGSVNATDCTASAAWSGSKGTSGQQVVAPSASGFLTYTLACSNATQTATASVNLVVTPAATPAPTVTIAVDPTSVSVGAAASLTWSSSNATACTASGSWTGAQAGSGTMTETPTAPGTQTFTLTCTGAGGSAHASATLTAAAPPPPAPTVTISVNPASVTIGASATLTWSSTNATACTASGAWAGTQAATGTATETPTAAGAQSFTLTCTGAGGSANASATLTATSPAPTVTLTLTPNSVTLGQSAALVWSSTNATACTASGAWTGSENTSGTATETPTLAGSQNFTLTCNGAGGSANATTTLTAIPLPVVVSATASGKVGGGGALDITTLAGLMLLSRLTWQMRGKKFLMRRDLLANTSRRVSKLALTTAAMVACGVLLASPGHAADDFGFDWQHAYLGARAGQALYKPSASSIENSIGDDADEISALSIDSHQFGGVLYAGVPIWKTLSLELGYAQLGQFPLSMTTQTGLIGNGVAANSRAAASKSPTFIHAIKVQGLDGADIDGIAQEVVDAAPPAGHGITLGLAFPLEVFPRVSVEPRFAALFYQSKQSLTTSDATLRNDNKGVGVDAGLALSVRVIGPVYLGASVDCFHQDRSCNVLLLSGQLEYRFGH